MSSDHPFHYRRRQTREVFVGDVGVGGANPIRVQSMTTPATTDTAATVEQIRRLVEAGCEIVRVTVPSKVDAENLPNIRREMKKIGIHCPLVADIHFTPAAAMLAVEHVEKIRINPGNFVDKKRFVEHDYSEDEYTEELDRLRDRFIPLVRRASELGVSMRVGTNHGSLSDRIMNRFGDTALGMVESALEFVRIAEGEGYHEIILSMKSSNPLVAIAAYRLLVSRMAAEDMHYPLHLGVTEAGDGEDARIKSAIGIGALLDEGIGDTVRVSLTEDPVLEIPVAQSLIAPYNSRPTNEAPPALATIPESGQTSIASIGDGSLFSRRQTARVDAGPTTIGDGEPVRNEIRLRTSLRNTEGLHEEIARAAGVILPAEKKGELLSLDVTSAEDAAELVLLADLFEKYNVKVPLAARLPSTLYANLPKLPELLSAVTRVSGLPNPELDEASWSATIEAVARAAEKAHVTLLFEVLETDVPSFIASDLTEIAFEGPVETAIRALRLARSVGAKTMVATWTTVAPGPTQQTRLLAARLDDEGIDTPILGLDLGGPGRDPLLAPAVHLGALLSDGLLDAIRVETAEGAERDVRFGYDILQGARQRVVKTEYIACPSCGRTLFDLEETTQRIRSKTSHLKGLKIAIMGCIVNGPGEMADADFGYVGWGPGKIALFAGKEMVGKDIPTTEASERLIALIKERGQWIDPPE